MSSHLSNIFRSPRPAEGDIESGPREDVDMAFQGVTSTGNQNHIIATLIKFTDSVLGKRAIEETEEVRIATALYQSLTPIPGPTPIRFGQTTSTSTIFGTGKSSGG
jgi:hypothetical protein